MITEIVPQNEQHFLDVRKGKIGSSDIAAACGLNKYKSRLQLWMEFTEKIAREPENNAMWMGKEMEPIVAKRFMKETGFEATHYGKIVINDKYPHSNATPDYSFITPEVKNGILECKYGSSYVADQWEGEQVPDHYFCQVNYQQGITERTEDAKIAIVMGHDFHVRDIPFDEMLFNHLLEQVDTFMDYVKRDIPPEAGEGDSKLISKLHKINEKEIITLDSDEAHDLFDQYLLISKQKKEFKKKLEDYESQEKTIKNNFRIMMGTAKVAHLGTHQIKLSEVQNKGYTVDPFSYVNVIIKE